MKKVYLVLLSISIALFALSDTVIQMEPYGGVYRIPCVVNGAKMKFIFDTGASDVCISMTMAEYLYDNGYIEADDIIGAGSSTVADGRIVDHIRLLLKDIQIDNLHIYNVEAVVVDGQNAPLLMGQSAIQKLGKIELNGSLLVIKNDLNVNSQSVDKLFKEAQDASDNRLYSRAVEKYSQLYQMNELSDYGKYKYSFACLMNKDPKKALSVLNEISSYDYFEENKIDIYRLYGYIHYDLSNYSEAIAYFDLSSNKIQTVLPEWLHNIKYQGDSYSNMNDFTTAAKTYRQGVMLIAYVNNVDIKYLQKDCKNELKKKQQSFRNDDLDYLFFNLILCNYRSGAWDSEGFLLEAAAFARAGNQYAMKMFNEMNIDPYSSAMKP